MEKNYKEKNHFDSFSFIAFLIILFDLIDSPISSPSKKLKIKSLRAETGFF
jgi:hypothetical protein